MWRTRMDGLCVSACSSRASAWVKTLLACSTSLKQRSPVCSTQWHCKVRSTFLQLHRPRARLCILRLDIAGSMPSACICALHTCIYLCHYTSHQPLALISLNCVGSSTSNLWWLRPRWCSQGSKCRAPATGNLQQCWTCRLWCGTCPYACIQHTLVTSAVPSKRHPKWLCKSADHWPATVLHSCLETALPTADKARAACSLCFARWNLLSCSHVHPANIWAYMQLQIFHPSLTLRFAVVYSPLWMLPSLWVHWKSQLDGQLWLQ